MWLALGGVSASLTFREVSVNTTLGVRVYTLISNNRHASSLVFII
jgi:hypothetical protein